LFWYGFLGWGGFAPPPPMAAVGGSSGVVRARVAALEAGTGEVVNRTFPPRVRTEVATQTDNGTAEVATQTDHMVFPFVFPGGGWTL
jgi:hypothetical protein